MEELTQFFDFIRMTSSSISGVGVLAVLFFLWKSGMIQFRKSNGRNGYTNGHTNGEHEKLWKELKDIKDNHLREIKNCVSQVKQDIAYMRGKMEKEK